MKKTRDSIVTVMDRLVICEVIDGIFYQKGYWTKDNEKLEYFYSCNSDKFTFRGDTIYKGYNTKGILTHYQTRFNSVNEGEWLVRI